MGAKRDELERRIAALEAHIQDLEDRLNERGVFSGDDPDSVSAFIAAPVEMKTVEQVQAAFDVSVREHRA